MQTASTNLKNKYFCQNVQKFYKRRVTILLKTKTKSHPFIHQQPIITGIF